VQNKTGNTLFKGANKTGNTLFKGANKTGNTLFEGAKQNWQISNFQYPIKCCFYQVLLKDIQFTGFDTKETHVTICCHGDSHMSSINYHNNRIDLFLHILEKMLI
jgi:hypothetical protein